VGHSRRRASVAAGRPLGRGGRRPLKPSASGVANWYQVAS
jgi:hypothetical protein